MTIVDSLKAKGSTGGNNIAEAIKNLPMGGGGGSLFVIKFKDSAKEEMDKTFGEIESAIKSGKIPVVYHSHTNTGTEGDDGYTKENTIVDTCSVLELDKHMDEQGRVYSCSVTLHEKNFDSIYTASSITDVLRHRHD